MSTQIKLEPHPLTECDRRLKQQPDYNIFRCTPKTFECSCGRKFSHVCDEAEGCSWVMVEPPRVEYVEMVLTFPSPPDEPLADGWPR